MVWLFVPGEAGLNLDSPLPSETITAASVTWREKRMLPQRWSKEWAKGGWIRLLSGIILTPSQAMSSVHSWVELIFSQAESPASRIAPPASNAEQAMNETSGPRQLDSSERYTQGAFFSKTSLQSPDTTGSEFGLSCETWVMRLRKAYSQRLRSEPTIAENASLFWPTATANRATYSNGQRGPNLFEAVTLWPTPKAWDTRPGGSQAEQKRHTPDLNSQVQMYPTPRANKIEGYSSENFRPTLAQVVTGQDRPTGGQLNPTWVEWLMGWPIEWTDLGSPVTELSRYKQRMRSQLCSLL